MEPQLHKKYQRAANEQPLSSSATPENAFSASMALNYNDPPPYMPIMRSRAKSSVEMTSPTMTATQLHDYDAVFTPSSPPLVGPSTIRKASSSSQLHARSLSNPEHGDGDSFSDEDGMLWTSLNGPRTRFGSSSSVKRAKLISTGPVRGAGETETELDEPPKHLPTSRRVPTPPPIASPTPLTRITPFLFQTFRLLSVVPAVTGALYHLFKFTASSSSPHHPIDHIVSILWALLTAHQCLRLTTGLLVRWKAYYPPLATHIRLLALQAICWPATRFTLILFNHSKRPVICWAIIGSTTCISRSVQIWVTSNLNFWTKGKADGSKGAKLGPRRWDWSEISIKCGLPMGVMYFVMAWAEAFRREIEGR